jgi:MFS family permease
LDTPRRQKATANRLLVIILCIILSIVLGTANTAVDTALLQVQEDILCDKLHQLNTPRDDGLGDPNDASRHCEDREVQAQLSIIRSWAIIFDLVPGLVMAIPFGLVADKQGRTLVLGLSILGTAASTAFQILVCGCPLVFLI